MHAAEDAQGDREQGRQGEQRLFRQRSGGRVGLAAFGQHAALEVDLQGVGLGRFDGAGDVLLDQRDRVGERAASRKPGGQRGRKRAPGAVRPGAGHTRRAELAKALPVIQKINDFGRWRMSTCDHDSPDAKVDDASRRPTAVVVPRDGDAGQFLGLGDIRRNDQRAAKQLRFHCCQRLVIDELLDLEPAERVPHQVRELDLGVVAAADVLEVLVAGLLRALELVLLRVTLLELGELGLVLLVALAQLELTLALDGGDLLADVALELRQVRVATLLVADSAQAGIFGRRWERRRAELYSSLNHQLSGQVQSNVARAAAASDGTLFGSCFRASPMAFAASLGTAIALIGAPAFLVVNGLLAQAGQAKLAIFSIAPIGLVLSLTGALFFLLVGRFLLPDRPGTDDSVDHFRLDGYYTELVLLPDSPLIGKTIHEVEQQQPTDFKVSAWYRNSRQRQKPFGTKKTQAGDVLVIRTNPDKIATIDKEPGIAIQPLEKYRETVSPSQENENAKDDLASRLVQSVVAPRSELIGKTIGRINFIENYGVIIVGVWRRKGWLRTELSRVRLREGDVLVMTGDTEALKRISEDRSFLMLVPFRGEPKPTHKARLAATIMVLSVALAAFSVVPIEIAFLTGAVGLAGGYAALDQLEVDDHRVQRRSTGQINQLADKRAKRRRRSERRRVSRRNGGTEDERRGPADSWPRCACEAPVVALRAAWMDGTP